MGEAVCRLLHLPWRHRLDAGPDHRHLHRLAPRRLPPGRQTGDAVRHFPDQRTDSVRPAGDHEPGDVHSVHPGAAGADHYHLAGLLLRADPAYHQHRTLDHAGRPGGVLQHQRQHHGPVAELVQPGGRHRDLSAVRGDLQQGAEPDRRGDGKRRRHRQGAQILTVERGGVAAPRGTRVWNINLPTGSGGAAPPPRRSLKGRPRGTARAATSSTIGLRSRPSAFTIGWGRARPQPFTTISAPISGCSKRWATIPLERRSRGRG